MTRMVALKGALAVLLWQGKEVEVPLASLSEADRKWIADWGKSTSRPPTTPAASP